MRKKLNPAYRNHEKKYDYFRQRESRRRRHRGARYRCADHFEIARDCTTACIDHGVRWREGLEDSRKARLAELFTSAVAPVAAEAGALVIDGGTQSGVMAMVGEALARDGRGSQLLGIAPIGKVTYPGGPNDANIGGGTPLEPNHSHFVLVESDEWGDETDKMFKLARALNVAVATMLINGGPIAENEALRSVRNGWPLLVVEGSGRFADELSAAIRNGQSTKSTIVSEIARSGRVTIFHVEDSAEKLRNSLRQMLGG